MVGEQYPEDRVAGCLVSLPADHNRGPKISLWTLHGDDTPLQNTIGRDFARCLSLSPNSSVTFALHPRDGVSSSKRRQRCSDLFK